MYQDSFWMFWICSSYLKKKKKRKKKNKKKKQKNKQKKTKKNKNKENKSNKKKKKKKTKKKKTKTKKKQKLPVCQLTSKSFFGHGDCFNPTTQRVTESFFIKGRNCRLNKKTH